VTRRTLVVLALFLVGTATLTGADAQRADKVPRIGYLVLPPLADPPSAERAAFLDGLRELGYIAGRNIIIEYRSAAWNRELLPDLAAELVALKVDVIVAIPGAIEAARDATKTIPIIVPALLDPVEMGLVTSLARPGGNLTGVNFFSGELVAKRLELMRVFAPAATRVGVLVNPTGPGTQPTLRDVEPAARALGQQIQVFNASTSREIDAVFATFVRERPDALFVGADSFLDSRRVQLVQLANQHRVPATYSGREYAEVGGLMSYGSDITDAYRQVGAYAGRILNGAKPADLPVVQASKFDFVINAQTARMLGITVPPSLLALADEVIE
jgi:putative tryptophan/tyrosine transport system substrate-binding protein